MNTMVNKLLDVDRQARQLLDEAKQYYEKTIEEIDREKEEIRQRYTERATGRVERVRQSETANLEEAISKIKAGTAEKYRRMEALYDARHTQWEEALFLRCIRKAVD